DRAQRRVLSQLRQSEDGHDCVADELLDGAPLAFEDRLHRLEVPAQNLPERLGIERLAETRRAHEVREEDRHGLTHLLLRVSRGEGRSAVAAEPEPIGVFLSALRADLHQPSVRPSLAPNESKTTRLRGT